MNDQIWQQAVGLSQKFKKQRQDSRGIGEKLLEWVGVSIFALLFVALIVIPILVYFIWAQAFVLAKLWVWFVVPIFPVSPLTLAQAWGISIIISFLTHVSFTWKGEDTRERSEKVTEFIMLFLKPWLVLGVAWVCVRFFL